MGGMVTVRWDALESWSPIALGLAGLAILTDVVIQVATTLSAATVPGWMSIALGLGGIWVLLTGLIGFYPRVADDARSLALGGVATGTLGWLAVTVGLVWAIALAVTNQGTIAEGPPLGPQIFLSTLVLSLLSFLCYGVASARTHSPSRTVGYLLMVPFATFLLLIALFVGDMVLGFEPPEGIVPTMLGIAALAMIGVGFSLRTGYAPLEPADPAETAI